MPKRLILHPGCPKTGTSSIQQLLFRNKDLLLASGIYVPTFLQRDEFTHAPHAWTSLLSFDELRVEPLVADFSAGRVSEWKLLRSQKLNELNDKLSQYSDYTWIISDEILAARMLDEHDLLRLKSIFVDVFDECIITFFIRDQLESALGQWSTDLINGSLQSEPTIPSDLPEDPARYLDYQKLLTRWKSCFPECRLTVSLFEKSSFMGDFASLAGFEITDAFQQPEPTNVSIPYPCIPLLAAYNACYPFFDVNLGTTAFRRHLPIALSTSFCRYPKYKPSPELVDSYQCYYEDCNEWVRENFFPHRERLWDSGYRDSTENSAVPLPEILQDSILDLIYDLSDRF